MENQSNRFRVSTSESKNPSRNQVETASISAIFEPKVSTVSTSEAHIHSTGARAHTRTGECPDIGTSRNGRNLETSRNQTPSRCYVCKRESTKFNRLAIRTDPDGADRLVHVGCLVKWNAWIRSICHVCRKGDIAGDRVGQFIGKNGRDVYLHQACWPAWSGKQLVRISDLPEKERRLVEGAFGIINEEQERQ